MHRQEVSHAGLNRSRVVTGSSWYEVHEKGPRATSSLGRDVAVQDTARFRGASKEAQGSVRRPTRLWLPSRRSAKPSNTRGRVARIPRARLGSHSATRSPDLYPLRPE